MNPGWTRSYNYNEDSQLEPTQKSNRLTSTTIGATTETYSSGGNSYDAHGNMLGMPQLANMQWDFKNQLQMTQRQAVNADDEDGTAHVGERTWYAYDASGQRTRKVTELVTDQIREERIYLGGFEIYRRRGVSPLVRETLHVMDDKRRIALVETRTEGAEPGLPAQIIRYQLSNHLGSASLELDHQAQIISYEEYYPYGNTSFQAVRNQTETPKRYRYTGKERDEESGLYYHGARYYAAWLGRWTAPDPSAKSDGLNLYTYVHNQPLTLVDPNGRDPQPDPMNYSSFEEYSEAMASVGVPWRVGYAEEEWGRASQQVDRQLATVSRTFDPSPPPPPDTLREDLERLRNVRTPLLSFIFPAHVSPYLRDQSIGIRNPYLRFQAQVNQRGGEAIARFTNRLGMVTVAAYGAGMILGAGFAVGVELAGPAVLAGGARLAAAYQEAGIVTAVNFPRATALVTAVGAGVAGVNLPASPGAPAAQQATRSVWALNPFVRGRLIERIFGTNLPSNYPVIDRVVQGSGLAAQEIVSTKSLNLGAASYQTGGAILSRLTGYINSLVNFSGRNWAGVNVTVGPNTQRVLELAIPATGATQVQLNALSQAAQLAQQRGVTLIIRTVQ